MTRILLVEDDQEVGRLLEHVLIAARYQVDRAPAVTAACSFLAGRAYDLVIADARLPDGTGTDVADQATEKGTKALIVTGYALQYPELRRYAFLMKPVRPNELLDQVRKLLGASA